MILTKLVLKRPVSTALVVLGILVFGVIALFSFDMELTPDIQMPMMLVNTVYPGAGPESIEQLVTKKIEDAGSSLSGVEQVLSYSYDNYSMVAFTYDYNMDMNDAYTDLSAALDMLKLPDDCQDPTIMQMDVNVMSTMTISVTNDGSSDMMAYIENTMVPALEAVPDVARVQVTGGRENYVRIQLDEKKMQQYGLNISGIGQTIGMTQYNVPAGTISGGSQDISVSTSSKYLSLDDVRNTVLTTSQGSFITLGDVADISMAAKDAESISRYNGQNNVSVSVTKRQSGSTVRVCRNLRKTLKRLESGDPGVLFDISYDAGGSITDSLKSVGETLIFGVVLAMVILFIFFGDWRASLIVGSSMPLSVFATLICMYLFGFNLNIITTGALVIAIGMIVDNSIVVIESCFRLRETTENIKEAAIQGAGTVSMSIFASTITTCVVYLPLSLISGMAGQMFSQLGMIIVFAMIASLIMALCIVPLLYVKVKPAEKTDNPVNHFLDRVRALYGRMLRRLLYRKKTTMAVSVLLLIISFFLASTLDFELIPTNYDGSITITSTFRSGTKLSAMGERMKELEKMVASDDHFKNYSLSISQNTATLTAYARKHCGRTSEEAINEYSDKLSGMTDVDIFVQASGGGSEMMSGYATDLVDIVLESDDLQALSKASDQVEALMRKTPGVLHVKSDASAAKSSAHVIIDPLKAANAGLSPAQIAGDLYQTLTGMTADSMEIDGKNYDIILRYPKGTYADQNQLMDKVLTGMTGRQTVLSDIAGLRMTQEPQMIQRSDGRYQQTISATVDSEQKSKINKTIEKKVKKMKFPKGTGLSSSYMDNMRSENLTAIFRAILSGIFLVFLVMAMQFESSRFSLMVMTCIPFSLIGSFLLLFITRNSLNMVSMMGFLMLMGIVVNNGILLVDTANQEKEHMALADALIRAGTIRLRPILMTTLTTILAMIPMALFSDNKMMSGMAFVIIGGLVASTLLCLLMMPTFYLILSRKRETGDGSLSPSSR
ncbi:MAG: efflux RND transporter permease subunit [Eubacterium sp.]|nr:efflux RND transporter permease subunit [Eubacterium sp.]